MPNQDLRFVAQASTGIWLGGYVRAAAGSYLMTLESETSTGAATLRVRYSPQPV